jgi:hypothetical protein
MCCAALLTFCVQAQQSNTVASINTQQVDSSIKVSVVDKLIKVSNAPQNSKMEIYNIVGSKVHEIEMKHASGEYLLSLPKGYYIVRIEGIVRKIVIR